MAVDPDDNIIFANGTTALDTSAHRGREADSRCGDFITGATGSNLLGTNYSALLKISLTGTASKTYDGNATATLARRQFHRQGDLRYRHGWRYSDRRLIYER
jgi:hypothetical protein